MWLKVVSAFKSSFSWRFLLTRIRCVSGEVDEGEKCSRIDELGVWPVQGI